LIDVSPANDPPSVNRRRALAALGSEWWPPARSPPASAGRADNPAKQAPAQAGADLRAGRRRQGRAADGAVSVTVKDGWFQRVALTNAEGKPSRAS
jgi:hypothetical protein